MKKSVRLGAGLGLAVAMTMSLTACGPGSSVPSGASTTPTAVSTDVSKGQYSLVLYDGAGPERTADNALIKAFEKKYPNITITGRYDPDNVTSQNSPRVIASPNPPDIARVTDMNSAVRGKHIISLDAYAKAYGWSLPSSQTELYRADAAGKIGSGSLYAIPSAMSVSGVFMNTALAKKAGINRAPQSVKELEADMAKAKTAKILPMMTYAKDGGSSFPFQALMTNNGSAQQVNDWIIQRPNATFVTPAAKQAATTWVSWNKDGYFPQGINALDGSTALNEFCSGQGVFFPSGDWNDAQIYQSLGSSAIFFAFPGNTPAQSASAAANAVSPFAIPVNSKNKNAAAAFLNFIQSDQARQIMVDNGYAPTGTKAMKATDSLQDSMLKAYAQVAAKNNTTDYINNATAGMQPNGIIPNFQLLLAGSLSPEQFTQAIQKQYESEVN